MCAVHNNEEKAFQNSIQLYKVALSKIKTVSKELSLPELLAQIQLHEPQQLCERWQLEYGDERVLFSLGVGGWQQSLMHLTSWCVKRLHLNWGFTSDGLRKSGYPQVFRRHLLRDNRDLGLSGWNPVFPAFFLFAHSRRKSLHQTNKTLATSCVTLSPANKNCPPNCHELVLLYEIKRANKSRNKDQIHCCKWIWNCS